MHKIIFSVFLALTTLRPQSSSAVGNEHIPNFRKAKNLAAKLHLDHATTIYCPCKYQGKKIDLASCGYIPQKNAKRAEQLEWEHVVPAESFGQSFAEWREGAATCVKKSGRPFKGRKCAETNAVFNRMESDLYNLWPSIGELNGLRSNFSMAEISGTAMTFGKCTAKIADRKFEPMNESKGIVARVYKYMDTTYPGHGIISEKNRKLFDAWDKMYPAQAWECERAERIERLQRNSNEILKTACAQRREPAAQAAQTP